jgi:hypothetical protein
METRPELHVVARWVGFAGHHSPGEQTEGSRVVALDLGAFEIAEEDFPLGVVTEGPPTKEGRRDRTLTLLHLEPPRLVPIFSLDLAHATFRLKKRTGESFRDIVVVPKDSARDSENQTRYRWHPPDGYQVMSP